MAKFILLYKGPATPMEEMTEEQSKKTMALWQTWTQKVGQALIDMGAPMANGRSVVDNGTNGTPSDLNGYSIIEANNIDEAVKLVDEHPFLCDKTGNFSVEVFELVPIQM